MSVSLSPFILDAKSFSWSQSSCFALFLPPNDGSDGTVARLLADDETPPLRSSFWSSCVAAAFGTGENDSTFVVRTQQQEVGFA
jgi:hypothetical protein